MDVDPVCGYLDKFRNSNSEKILMAVDQSFNKLLGGQSDVLVVLNWKSNFVVPYAPEDTKLLCHFNKVVAVIQLQY